MFKESLKWLLYRNNWFWNQCHRIRKINTSEPARTFELKKCLNSHIHNLKIYISLNLIFIINIWKSEYNPSNLLLLQLEQQEKSLWKN